MKFVIVLLFFLVVIILSTLADLILAPIRIRYWERKMESLDIPLVYQLFMNRYFPGPEISPRVKAAGDYMYGPKPPLPEGSPEPPVTQTEIEKGVDEVLLLPVGPILPESYLHTSDDSFSDLTAPLIQFVKRSQEFFVGYEAPLELRIRGFRALCHLSSIFQQTPLCLARIFELRTWVAIAKALNGILNDPTITTDHIGELRSIVYGLDTAQLIEKMFLAELGLCYFSRKSRITKEQYQKFKTLLAPLPGYGRMQASMALRYHCSWTMPVFHAVMMRRYCNLILALRANQTAVGIRDFFTNFSFTLNPFSLFSPLLNDPQLVNIMARCFEIEESRPQVRSWMLQTLERIENPFTKDVLSTSEIGEISIRIEGFFMKSTLTFSSYTGRTTTFEVARPTTLPPTVS